MHRCLLYPPTFENKFVEAVFEHDFFFFTKSKTDPFKGNRLGCGPMMLVASNKRDIYDFIPELREVCLFTWLFIALLVNIVRYSWGKCYESRKNFLKLVRNENLCSLVDYGAMQRIPEED